MVSIRSITVDEARWFGTLGESDVREDLAEAWEDGTSRPEWTLVAEESGRVVARATLLAEPMGGGVDTLEGTVGYLWADLDHPGCGDAIRELTDAMVERLAPYGPTTLDRRLNPEVHANVDRMRPLLESAGFHLLQEKAGFAWTSSVSMPSPPDGRLVSIAEAGADAYRRVIAATTTGTLDRNDLYYIGQCGPEPWATEIMSAMEPGDEASWLLVLHGEEPAGFVAVSAFDDQTWTIVHIGVVPAHRGHGHVAELLAAADLAARERGFTAGLSDVDVENRPMIAAMERAGHRTDLRPWHVWHYRRDVPSP